MKLTEAITFKNLNESLNADMITSDDGIGGVPNNKDVDYLGVRVLMTPDIFLELAARISNPKSESIDYLIDQLDEGNPIAPPSLNIQIPNDWQDIFSDREDDVDYATVTGHEGRHRMMAVDALYGDNTPVEVHVFFDGFRNRHISDRWIEKIMTEGLIPERANVSMLVKYPFIQVLS